MLYSWLEFGSWHAPTGLRLGITGPTVSMRLILTIHKVAASMEIKFKILSEVPPPQATSTGKHLKPTA